MLKHILVKPQISPTIQPSTDKIIVSLNLWVRMYRQLFLFSSVKMYILWHFNNDTILKE